MIGVSFVPRDQIQHIYDRVIELLRPCERFTGGRYLAEDMVDLCVDDRSGLFIAFDDTTDEIIAAVVATIVPYPRKTALLVQFLGGDRMRLWRQNMYELLDDYGARNGCDVIEGVGRIGWLRFFKLTRVLGFVGENDIGQQRRRVTAD